MPTEPRPLRVRVALALAALLLGVTAVGVAMAIHPRARPPAGYAEPDQQVYRAMAASPFSSAPTARVAPFAWRVLPSLIVWASGAEPDRGFRLLTVTSFALIPGAMILLLLALRISAPAAMLTATVAALLPSLSGFLAWAYVMTDAFALLVGIGVMWAVVTRRTAWAAALMVAMALTKETWLLTAIFAILYTRTHEPQNLRTLAVGCTVAAAAWLGLRASLVPSQPYDPLTIAQGLHSPLIPRNVFRRLLLGTAATWNVLAPMAAWSLGRLRASGDAVALGLPIAASMAQMLFATDSMRPVAAAYPFVLVLYAMELDRWSLRTQLIAGSLIAAAQLPWLLNYGWVVQIPLRGVEIVLALAAVGALAGGWRHPAVPFRRTRTAPSFPTCNR